MGDDGGTEELGPVQGGHFQRLHEDSADAVGAGLGNEAVQDCCGLERIEDLVMAASAEGALSQFPKAKASSVSTCGLA